MFLARILRAGESRRRKHFEQLSAAVVERRAGLRSATDDELRASAASARRHGPMMGAAARLDLMARVSESARRRLGEEPRPSQIQCALAIAEGCVAELPTGEGKTLAAALAGALWAAEGGGLHVMTANEYLARRDAYWMKPVFEGVGLTVGAVHAGQSLAEKQKAYAADVTYGTNLEIGFDYLRDGLALSLHHVRQRGLTSVIVDEADSLLVDEARIPLVLSTPVESTDTTPYLAAQAVESLEPYTHFAVDLRRRLVWLTETGIERVEGSLKASLYELADRELLRHVEQALRARALLRRDRDYVVRNGEVHLIDEYTGRIAVGRRWSEGLQQAVEAKERLPLSRPRTTAAQITMPALISLYDRVGGMTATAIEVSQELSKVYGLEVVAIASHRASRREDQADRCFEGAQEKVTAVVEEVAASHRRGQPVLVGCGSVDTSEELSGQLTHAGVPHVVLNAKDDAKEAEIIALAGRPGSVTVATHLAGRGVDIRLGGKPADPKQAEVAAEAGGLRVIGTERYESTRIERQLRGRSGRQGEPGSSQFFVSLEDPVVAAWAPSSPRLDISTRLSLAQDEVSQRNATLREDALAFGAVFEVHRRWAREERDRLMVECPEELADFDRRWVQHLQDLFLLLDSIHLRAWGGEIPLAAWHRGAYELYQHFATADAAEPADASGGRSSDSRTASEWLAGLGPRRDEPEWEVTGDPPRSRGISRFAGGLGAGVILEVVVVADVDGVELPVVHSQPSADEAALPD